MKKNLLKSMGVAMLTLLGTSVAYADLVPTTKTYDFEGENAEQPFTARSRMSVSIGANEALGSNVLNFVNAGNCQNGYGFANFNFSEQAQKAAQVKIEFDYYATDRGSLTIGDGLVRGDNGGCGKNTYGSIGAILRIGTNRDNFLVNGTTYARADYAQQWLHVTATVYNFEGKVEWAISKNDDVVLQSGTTEGEGDEAVFTPGKVDFWQADANECTQIDVFGWINKSTETTIDNLSVTTIVDTEVVFADYTIQYVGPNGEQLKEGRTGNGRETTLVNLLASDKNPIYANDKKYIYESDDSETVAIKADGTAVITVTFREAEVYGAMVNCVISGVTGQASILDQLMGYTFFEGDNLYVYPARGYGKDGKYYFTAPTTYNCVSVTFPGSFNTRTIGGVKTYIGQVDYSEGFDEEVVTGKDDEGNDVKETVHVSPAYYSDFERLALPTVDEGDGVGLGQISGTTNSTWGYEGKGKVFGRFSQGRGIRLDEGSYVWTEPIAEAANYQVRIYGRNDWYQGGSGRDEANPYALGLLKDDETVIPYNIEIPSWTSALTGSYTINDVPIPAGGKLVIMNTNTEGGLISLDDITIIKTGDYDPTVTSITNVQAAQQNGILYNLAGQAVKNATKGIYIKNGKKVVIK